MPFTSAGAWHFIADLIEDGHLIGEVLLEQPHGAFGYEMHVETGAESLLYIKVNMHRGYILGRSFHYSYRKRPTDFRREPDRGRSE